MSVTATADDIVLTQPMAVLRQFSEVELDRLATIARRDKELLQQTMTNALARAERALNEERRRAEEAEAANARLREKLRSLGVDSDE
jgi:hypothetical protein